MTGNSNPIATPAPLINEEGEVRELTAADFALFKPTSAIPELVEILRRNGRPPLPEDARKQRVTLYLDLDLLARLNEDGHGWQTRANATLRKALGL